MAATPAASGATPATILCEAPTSGSAAISGSSVLTDRDVLLHLYQTAGGESWRFRDGWAENASDLSAWYGVATNNDGRVVGLELMGEYCGLKFTGNNLTGTIPALLGKLDALKTLDLTGNFNIHGTIPPELGQLQKLEVLTLSYSQLEGNIPRELGRLTSLRRLSLARNWLRGPIPPQLGNNVFLEYLNLYSNLLSGEIPSQLGQLRRLRKLFLAENWLSGTIPPELGRLKSLENLRLGGNILGGAIPSELGNLQTLKVLMLQSNELTGEIPPELGSRLQSLKKLSLSGNYLSGSIPPELGRLGALHSLYLRQNNLSGSIPPELGKLDALSSLFLSGNKLSGTIPKELGNMKALRLLSVDDNNLKHLGDAEDALRLVTRVGSKLHLSNNPWISPPEAVVEEGKEGIVKYLMDMRKAEEANAEVKTLRLLKVVLIGSPSAGKSSLVRSIVSGRGSPTVGCPADVSTVGIELLRHQLQGTTVEFYDCAGQLDYAGMHQTFLSRRALYLVVWDIGRCVDKDGEALDAVVTEDIMQWLFALHLRAPGSTVMLVANKCDGVSANFGAISDKVKHRVATLLQDWQTKRGLHATSKASEGASSGREDCALRGGAAVAQGGGNPIVTRASHGHDLPAAIDCAAAWLDGNSATTTSYRLPAQVSLLPEPSLVSCLDDGSSPEVCGLSALIDRVAIQGATAIRVPPAWGLALRVLDALREKQDPLAAARSYLQLDEEGSPRNCTTGGRSKGSSFMSKETLLKQWNSILRSVESELKSPRDRMAVANSRSALEGALWISEFAGQIIRVAGGDVIFLDVVWLTTILGPILSHKLLREIFPSHLTKMRDELAHNGILRLEFARHLWGREIGGEPSESVVEALCRVIFKLGVALPLASGGSHEGIEPFPGTDAECGGDQQDMLVIMRLPDTCVPKQQRKLDASLTSALEIGGAREVTLKWRFDWAGPPAGLVERLISSCHVIGKVEQSLCWRRGALFKSHLMAARTTGGNEPGGRLYTFVLRLDKKDGDESWILTLRMIGPLEDARVWGATRWVASAMINLSREWRGVLWEGWPECAKHPDEKTYLATPDTVNVGDLLLPDADPGVTPTACDCQSEENEVLSLVLRRLGTMVDTQRGLFLDDRPRTAETALLTTTSEGTPRPAVDTMDPPRQEGAPVVASVRPRHCCCCCTNDTFRMLHPTYRDAWKTAGGFWAAAIVILGAGATLKDTDDTGWTVCLGLMGLFLVGAGVATVFAFRWKIQEVRREDAERREGGHRSADVENP